jgi:hypothetical protein
MRRMAVVLCINAAMRNASGIQIASKSLILIRMLIRGAVSFNPSGAHPVAIYIG